MLLLFFAHAFPFSDSFKDVFGDPDWIRTNNLPLRRGLLCPVEPRGHAAPVCRVMGHVARAWTSLAGGCNSWVDHRQDITLADQIQTLPHVT